MYDRCFKYGMNAGCDINCPVLQDGECELSNDENRFLVLHLKLEKILKKIKNN